MCCLMPVDLIPSFPLSRYFHCSWRDGAVLRRGRTGALAAEEKEGEEEDEDEVLAAVVVVLEKEEEEAFHVFKRQRCGGCGGGSGGGEEEADPPHAHQTQTTDQCGVGDWFLRMVKSTEGCFLIAEGVVCGDGY